MDPLPNDPEVATDQACETAINALDQLMAIAANKETSHLVAAEWRFIDQIATRIQLLQTFIVTSKQHLRVVSNG